MKLTWKGEGKEIKIAGAFNNWTPADTLQQEDNSSLYQQEVQPGKYAYKWVVDGVWLVDSSQPSEPDESGNVNNIEVVEESNKETIPAQIHLTIHAANNLPKMDVTSAGDPYVIIKYGSIEFRSETKPKTSNPEWNFKAVLRLNTTDKDITVTLYDEDKHTKDDLIGEVTLSVDDLIKQEVVTTQTANLSKKGEISYSATVKTVSEKSVEKPRGSSEEHVSDEATTPSEETMSGDSDSWERVSVGDCAGSAENVAEADRENEEMVVESEEKEAIEGTTTTKEGFVIAEVEENNNQSKNIINIERIFSWSEEFDSKIISGSEPLEDDNYPVLYWDTQDYNLLKQGIWCKQVRDTWILRCLADNKVQTLKNVEQIDECLKSVLQTKESLNELLKSTLTKKIEFEGALSRWKHNKIIVEKVQEGDLKTVTLRTQDCMMSGLKNIYTLSNQLSLQKLKLI